MFCSKCGKQTDDNGKFCENCGAVINTQTISNEKSEQFGFTSRNVTVKKEINKPLVITIIIAVIVLIAGGAGVILFDNYNHKKGSEIYLNYLAKLNEIDAQFKGEYGNNYIPYYQYYLYDINQDGIYELLVHIGEGEAVASIRIYSVNENGRLIDLGEIGGGHTWLSEKNGELYSNFGHQGHHFVEKIIMTEDLGSWIITKTNISQEDNLSDYESYGTSVKCYDISDTSAIEALCPK